MRAGMHVAGSSIDRVFNQPIAPARKFRGTIDAALTLALGSVCALGLTLGPAPMNTVALSAPSASSASGPIDPAPETVLVPGEVDNAGASDKAPEYSSRPGSPANSDTAEPAPSEPPAPAEPPAPVEPRRESTNPSHPLDKQPPPQRNRPQHPTPAEPNHKATGPQLTDRATALSVVQNYRIASGLGAFVAAGDCAQPVVHSVVPVTPSLTLPPGAAKKSLAPDPAFATVDNGPGALKVTVYRCQ